MWRTPIGVLLVAAVWAPEPAHACGGFFCSTSPVDQAGERIVWSVEDDGTILMAVEIVYSGFDEDFAWILPVPVPPELMVGTDALFDALDVATAPRFETRSRTDGTCRVRPRCFFPSFGDGGGGGGCFMGDAAGGAPFADAGAGGPPSFGGADASARDAGGGGVVIHSQEAVGPYETVVLGASTADEVVEWLREHSYDIPEETVPLLRPYAEAGHVFVALRLSANRDTSVLRPILMKMVTAEACLPIRLTAIATVPDMPITGYFLGADRFEAVNYSTAEVDVSDMRLWEGGTTWTAEVTRAVDGLSGRAFVTDYAGPTPRISIELPSVYDLAAETDPGSFLAALQARGYAGDALLLDILQRYLVPPAGWEPRDYYNCLFSRGYCDEPASFDPEALAAAIEAELTQPRRDAQEMVDRHPQLTRLYTTMSGDEMTVDPVFRSDPRIEEVSNVHVATYVTECGPDYFQEQAPMHVEVGDLALPRRAGTRETRSDDQICHAMGGHAHPIDEPASSGGGGCSGAGAAGVHTGPIAAALVALWLRARRRRRR